MPGRVQPTLRTERIELVPLSEQHLEFEVQLDADAEVLRYIEGRARTRTEAEAGHRRRLSDAHDGLGVWAGFVDSAFIGWWCLRASDDPNRGGDGAEAELGYRLGRRWWRQGLASEGSRELLRYGFVAVRLDRVFAQTMAVNAGSRGVMRTVGMTHVRTFDGHFDDPLPGTDEGEVEYAISREEWLTAAVSTR